MYQRDFILRMIEQIALMIAGILGLINKGDYDKAEEQIDEAYTTFLKEDAAFFSAIPIEKLTETLLNEHNYTQGHLEILADLLYAQGELYLAQNVPDKALGFLMKSHKLYKYVQEKSDTYSFKTEERVQWLEGKVTELLTT